MSLPLKGTEQKVEDLDGIIGWFYQSSCQLTEEYRRLERRLASLDRELESKNKALEESLCEREEARGYLLSVLESLKAGVLVLNRDLVPTFANRRMKELVGDIDRERAIQLIGDKIAGCLREGEDDFFPLECERVVATPGGGTIPVHLTISEVAIAARQSANYVLVFQDISRIKRLETEAARSRRLAALGEMAAGLAHEVRSPLGGIELYASLLKEREEGEPKRLAAEILTAVQRLHTTMSRLLSFAAEPRINPKTLPVSQLLREVKEMASPLLQQGKCALEIEDDPEPPPLWGDRELLVQVLLNLVVNAAEAMSDGGTVRIDARPSPLYTANGRIHRIVEIRVTDQGVGISPENREKIFDPFFTTKSNGTGLGLALAHKITYAHSGSIEVSSQPGQGSSFTLFLPVADDTK